jgi:indolepyruvate decarboxylase
LLLHHQARRIDSQAAIYREITCDQAFLADPASAPSEINRVLRSALERSLPVYIEIPRDMVAAEVVPQPRLPKSPVDPEALAECAEEIAARMNAAERPVIVVDVPVIVVDVEVRRYGLEASVAALARKFGAPVVTTFMGRGLLAGEDVLAGTYMGAAGEGALTQMVENANAALLLGVILSDTNFALSRRRLDPRRTMLAIDRVVTIGHHAYAGIALDAVVEAVAARASPRRLHGGPGRLRRRRPFGARYRTTKRRSCPPTSPAPSTICSMPMAPCR